MPIRSQYVHPDPHDQQDVCLDQRKRVQVRHPGYPDATNIILTLPAQDYATGGLHYETVLTACGILTGNRWDGYLSKDREGPAVPEVRSQLIAPGDYYFYLPHPSSPEDSLPLSNDNDYPLFSTFGDWPFPHQNLPPLYSSMLEDSVAPPGKTDAASSLGMAVNRRDMVCRLTGFEEAADVAHLIPAKEEDWFDRNAMSQYNCDATLQSSINDVANCMLLRADVHRLFDRFKFVFIPKPSTFDADDVPVSSHLVCHMLGSSPELSALYHNVAVRPTPGLAVEYLLAAFARAIFPLLGSFLRCKRPRRLMVICDDEYIIKDCSGEECASMALATGSRSRSISPRKRGAPVRSEGGIAGDSIAPQSGDIRGLRKGKDSTINRLKRKVSTIQMPGHDQISPSSPHRSSPLPKRMRCSSTSLPSDGGDHDSVIEEDSSQHLMCGGSIHSSSLDEAKDNSSNKASAHIQGDQCARSWIEHTPSARSMMPADIERLAELRKQGLQEERQKSGTEDWWGTQSSWAWCNACRGLSPQGLRRLYWVQGKDENNDVKSNGTEPWELGAASSTSGKSGCTYF